MKVEVIELFYDRDNILHQVGESLEIAEKDRVEKLAERKLVKVVGGEAEKPSVKTTTRKRKE